MEVGEELGFGCDEKGRSFVFLLIVFKGGKLCPCVSADGNESVRKGEGTLRAGPGL